MSSFTTWNHISIDSEAIEQAGYVVLISSINKAYGLVVHKASGHIFKICNNDGAEVDSYQVLEMITEWSKQ
jgi:hypothetical protein